MSKRPLRILVVEDEGLVAMVLEENLIQLGYDVAGPVNSTAKALALLKESSIDGAILDINLGGERVDPVVHALAASSIPFIFATGYSVRHALPIGFEDRTILRKPYTGEELADALQRSLPN